MRPLQLDPRHNEPFSIALLHAVMKAPGLDRLRGRLVLKGGAALLLAYRSGRATRKDLDFDILPGPDLTEDDFLRLLNALRPWAATYSRDSRRPGGYFLHEHGIDVGPIGFRNVVADSQPGLLELQISLRRIPPPLHEWIELAHAVEVLTGDEFEFPVMPLEAIAAEKAVRSVNKRGPKVTDLYDIGYITTTEDIDASAFIGTFRQTYDEEAGIVMADHNETEIQRLVTVADAAQTIAEMFGDERVIDPEVDVGEARRRVRAGAALVLELVGTSA